MMRHIIHPGPARASRMDLVPCAGREIEVNIAAGIALEDAVASALAPLGIDSAWLEIAQAEVETLRYVIPADAPDERHVAWYSEAKGFDKGRIDRLGMIVGAHRGASFLHGHGLWTPEGGVQAMGHILAPQTRLTSSVVARGIGLCGARFDRRLDTETAFELFHADPIGPGGDGFAALRLLPNQDVTQGLVAACQALRWPAARVHGLGSVNTACFEDGRLLDSLPTEFLITNAITGPDAPGPEIVIVGTDGGKILSGRLLRGANAVLVTAELVLSRMNV